MELRASHMRYVLDLDNQAKMVKRAVKLLKPFVRDFDCIAVSGMSGALIAPLISQKLQKPLVLVRKEQDSSHTAYMCVEGVPNGRYIILDDFIATGHTVRFMIDRIAKTDGLSLELVGMYMYRGFGWYKNGKEIEEAFNCRFYGDDEAI